MILHSTPACFFIIISVIIEWSLAAILAHTTGRVRASPPLCSGTQASADSHENFREDSSQSMPFDMPWVRNFSNPSISTEPNFIVGEWSSCSSTCGKGIRKRSVECKIFLEFSRTIARLPDTQCSGPKPNQIETCFDTECHFHHIQDESPEVDDNENEIIDSGVEMPINKMIPLSKVRIEDKYYWKNAGFTQCSASCLGGTQESIIECISDANNTVVNPYLCDINEKPDAFTRTCNDNPCPPRWDISEYSVCSKRCGGGVQVRDIKCVHEVTRGISNTIVVPTDHCPPPMPRGKQFCNAIDCPPQWKTGLWTKCSKSCGGGVKTRKLKCIKELAFGEAIELFPSKCSYKRPKSIKTCSSKPCRNSLLELRKQMQRLSSHENISPQINNIMIENSPKKRISLKVSGEAIVLEGTHIRLRCPQNKSAIKSNQIDWYKNNFKVIIGKKFHYNRNILRIKNSTISDSGIYSCVWNNKKTYSIDLQIKKAQS